MGYTRVIVSRRGGAEVLETITEQEQRPGPGQVLVRVLAAGVSFGDILLRVGVIPGGPKPPFTPGYDVTGVVQEVGPGVTRLRPGQRVVALVREGGYTERLVVPEDRAVLLPDGIDPADAAAVALNYFVAYQMLHRVARVREGQSILVHGAAGGVGTALLQLAQLAKVQAFGTSSAGKADLVASLGAQHIDYLAEDFMRVVKDRPENGVDAVFDPVGGTQFMRSYMSLRRGGFLVGYGQSQAMQNGRPRRDLAVFGFVAGLFLPKLAPDGRRTTFYNAWSLEKKVPSAYQEDLAAVLDLLATGAVKPVLSRTLPLAKASEAHQLLEAAAVTGKVVLRCDEASEPVRSHP
ncbi:medium chain dehydrogenase/reductase family protein [Kitasatospora viridis]|uniref:NADPH:quinone reductase-like Zn-dependent oxidoreductase n=1 Tax=Kitasatospora viridis TaxID=281105 RepID=A0A561UCF6_9ACTN|nr:medium chain dehydrogenase/reductase family protein [Kitasatospora viridis]TWF97036.1 NADPH:quinone reductase-like Zn-dependent oxidoreductase [Kitasatospora viridis]